MGRGAGIRARGGSGGFVDLSGFQIDAKRRFHAAIDAAGPGLADMLWRVACSGEGMREAEVPSAGRRERASCSRSRSTASRIITASAER